MLVSVPGHCYAVSSRMIPAFVKIFVVVVLSLLYCLS